MTAGLNHYCNIWRMNNDPDDGVGGAMITGTVVHWNLAIRFQAQDAEQLLMQQGLETPRTFSSVVSPGTLDIRERDEVEIIFPPTSVYLNKRFRIVGVMYSDFIDPRKYMRLDLTRSVRAHNEQ